MSLWLDDELLLILAQNTHSHITAVNLYICVDCVYQYQGHIEGQNELKMAYCFGQQFCTGL